MGHGRPRSTIQAGWHDGLPVLETISKYIPPAWIDEVLHQTGRREKRRRRVPASAVVWLVLMMGLRSDLDVPAMWRQVCRGVHGMLGRLDRVSAPTKVGRFPAPDKLGA